MKTDECGRGTERRSCTRTGDLLVLHQSVPHAGVHARGAEERVLLFDRDALESGGWHEDDRYETQTFWWEVRARSAARGARTRQPARARLRAPCVTRLAPGRVCVRSSSGSRSLTRSRRAGSRPHWSRRCARCVASFRRPALLCALLLSLSVSVCLCLSKPICRSSERRSARQLEDRCLFVATLYAARTGAGAPLAHVVDERAAARYGVAAEALEREWLGGQAERHTSDAALTAFLYADARWAALGLG